MRVQNIDLKDRLNPAVVAQVLRPRVLVAERTAVIGLDLADTLLSSGCDVVGPFHVAADVIKLVMEQHLDFAIVDLKLLNEDFQSLTGALRARGVSFAITSGLSPELVHSWHPGVPILQKPFGAEQVVAILKTLRLVTASTMHDAGSGFCAH
jgi:DNA-binding response OmpR family regulator